MKVELDVPKGLNVESVKPVQGFEHHFRKIKGKYYQSYWTATGKGIGPHEFIEFPIVVANPKEEGKFKWNAIQTYDNGDVVKWTGKEDSEHPAPTTTVKRCKSNDTHSDSSQGDSIVLWIVAIVAIVISLIALLNKRVLKSNH